jgi:hypothetical protein
MNWTKLPGIVMTMAAVLIASPATAYADPVPTVDEVAAAMAELTEPAANKNNIVTPAFSPEETQTVNDHLNQMNANGLLPLTFVVTDIEPAPDNLAGATVATTGSFHQRTPAAPIVLTHQGGRWLITHDTAMPALDNFWNTANRHRNTFVPPGAL